MKKPELLAPAGSPEALDAAIGEGADAVYLGLKTFNARMRSSNFAYSQFEAAVDALHRLGKGLYVTVNTVFEEREADRVYQLLQYLSRVGPDGIIVQDLGVARMAAREFPGLALNASTQMNVASAAGANFLSRIGFKRVVLSRELSGEEIAAVARGTNLEIETFVHGALCVSCSGLCLFSSFLGGKSANRGTCAQACRRLYHAEGRDGYFFSPDDLELVGRLPELAAAGVASLKIEGRMKSAEYVGTVVAAYRAMLDGMEADPEAALRKARSLLSQDFARRKTEYFHASAAPDFIHPEQAGGTGISLGSVLSERGSGDERMVLASALAAGSLPPLLPQAGDSLRVHAKDDSERRTERVVAVQRGEAGLWISLSGPCDLGDSLYIIQTKAMSRRYKALLPGNLDRYRRLPSHDASPPVSAPELARDALSGLPEGLYAMTDKLEDLYLFQADPPVKAILRLKRSSSAELLERLKTLPFRGEGLVIALEPFFPESDAAWLEESISALSEAGVRTFIANNLGQLTLLRNRGLRVIAGDYLYAFNPWAAALLLEQGASAIVPPLEGSKRNLQSTFEDIPHSAAFLTVFAYPALFRIRADLSGSHGFRDFSGRDDEAYELSAGPDGSIVAPRMPFSLTDRIEWLRKEGFRRLILDFSWIRLKKPLYKEAMKAARESALLPGTLRFNWKDGFWNPEEPGTASLSGRPISPAGSSAPAERPAAAGRSEAQERPQGQGGGQGRGQGSGGRGGQRGSGPGGRGRRGSAPGGSGSRGPAKPRRPRREG